MTRTWTVSAPGRYINLVAIAVFSLWIGQFFAVDGRVAAGALATAVVLALGLPLWVISSLRPRVILTSTEVIVRNPLNSRRVRLADVTHVEGGWGGLTIGTLAGVAVTAWAVQKSNYARWSGRRTRADDIADEIMAAARQAKSAGAPAP